MSILFCRRRKKMAMFKCAYLFAFFFLLAFLAEAGENIITIPSLSYVMHPQNQVYHIEENY